MRPPCLLHVKHEITSILIIRKHQTHCFSLIEQNIPSMQQQQELMSEAIEKAKRAAELQAKIQAQLSNKPNLVS